GRAARPARYGPGRQAHLPAPARTRPGRAGRRGRVPGRRAARAVAFGGAGVNVTGRVVTPSGVIDDGVVSVSDGRITSVSASDTVHSGHWIVPGFVDIHVHGGGGYTFTTGDPDQARGAGAFHLRHGTTTLLASLVSSPFELMLAATKAYAPLVAEGVLAGVHFEGPYLSGVRCGAQNPAYLRDASVTELESLIEAGGGAVRMVTLAPEVPGALEAIELLVRHGVVAAIGHTDATYDQTRQGIAAAALRHAVHIGLSIVDACRMASTTPAAAIGLDTEVGALRAGLRADLVELSEDLEVVRVMRAGTWI